MEGKQANKRFFCKKSITDSSHSILLKGLTLLLIVGIVLVVRYFCFASYRVSTNDMKETLNNGDFILVNKLPMKNNPGRNRTILFYSPLQRDRSLRPLFLSRCIGMPGDTILVDNEGYQINGKRIPFSPRALATYYITSVKADTLSAILNKLKIPVRNWKKEKFGFSFSLTSFEEYQIREEIDESMNISFVRNRIVPYRLVVPRKNRAYRLDAVSLTACKEAILREKGEMATFKNGKLYLEGVETKFFFFHQDYYWVLSDNMDESIDSRHLGFIPASHVVGNAFFCWYSPIQQHRFKSVK